MIPKFNERTMSFEFQLEENDSYDILQIEEMLAGHYKCRHCGKGFESKGWSVLEGYFKRFRELLIGLGKAGIHSRTKRELSDLRFAMISGHDNAVTLALRLIAQRQKLKKLEEEANKTREGLKNARNDF